MNRSPRAHALAIVFFAATLLGGLAPVRGAEALKSPFAALVPRDMRASARGTAACAAAPPAQNEVQGVSYYVDPKHSIADPELQRRNVAQLKPVRDYLAGIVRMTDAAVQGSASDAACAMTWLRAWAAAGAMLGSVNRQGEYEREWTLGGLALEYLKLRDTGRITDTAARRAVEGWLAAIARAVMPASEHEDEQNNHAYWTGMAVAATGVAADDRDLFAWGMAKFDLGDDAIAADGTLPLEMKRGRRALHYHLFALTPLVMLAEIGEANGLASYARKGGALKRLVERDLAGLRDPSFFAGRTGEVQDIAPAATPRMDEIAWFEPYRARFGSVGFDDLLAKYRPIEHPWLGGNLTQLYAGARN